MSKAPAGLDRGSLGTAGMSFFTISASAPMTVLAGSVVATFAATGVKGVPLSFLVLAVALWPFTVAYTTMSRHVSHAGVFYAYLARGLGRMWGVAGGLVAVVSYNAIQICLYGLLGASLEGLLPKVGFAWWVWAGIAWAAVATLGILHININARVLAVLLVAEVGMILLFDIGAFTHPAGGSISFAGLAPSNFFVSGIGGVLAFGIAAFVGYESGPVYGEEAKGPGPVSRATFGALFFLGLLYAVSSLALTVTTGPDNVVDDAQRQAETGIPFSVLSNLYGGWAAGLANLLLITSIFGALLSFHNTVARYVFAMSRERVLPPWLGRIGTGSAGGAPIGGSLLQSVIAVVVFGAFAVTGANPVTTLFTWLSYVAAVGVLLLLIGTSLAVIGYFRRNPQAGETTWRSRVAPVLGAVALTLVLGVTVWNSGSILGTQSLSVLTIVLPAIIALAAVIGVLWGMVLRESRPGVYEAIGAGQTKPLAVLSHAFSDVDV